MNTERLHDLREYNGFYQREVADAVGVTRTFYSLWESGINIIPLKYLVKISQFYHVSMDYIIGLSEEKNLVNNKMVKLNLIDMGERLKLVRLENDLTLKELSKILNTGVANLSRYENGKNTILTSFAYQICKKYGISLDWLCGMSDKKSLF